MIQKLFLILVISLSITPTLAQEVNPEPITLTELSKFPMNVPRYYSVAWHPEQDLLLGNGGLQGVQIWDIDTQTVIHEFQSPDFENLYALSTQWSPSGQLVAILAGAPYLPTTTVILWDWEHDEIVQIIDITDSRFALPPTDDPVQNEILSIDWSPTGEYLATVESWGLYLRIWSVGNGDLIASHQVIDDTEQALSITTANWLPNGRMFIAAIDERRHVPLNGLNTVIDPITGEIQTTFDEQMSVIRYSTTGGSVLAINDRSYRVGDHQVWLWNYETQGSLSPLFSSAQDRVGVLAVSPDGNMLAVDRSIWDLGTLTSGDIPIPAGETIRSVTWRFDNQQFAVTTSDGVMRIMQIER